MISVSKPVILCDSGLLSRVFLGKSPYIEVYQTARSAYQLTISTAVLIELHHWLLIQRGLLTNSISRAEYDRHRNRIESYPVLNSEGVSEASINVARRWPDTGVGDSYTIATALVFDVPVFTLNPKHFERVVGLALYKPDNYPELIRSVNRF